MHQQHRIHKLIFGLTILSLVIVPILYALKIWQSSNYSDFLVYFRAASRFKYNEFNIIYNLDLDGNCPFRYAPPTLLLFRPLAFFTEKTAALIWYLLQLISYLAGFVLLYRGAASYFNSKTLAKACTCLAYLCSLRFCLDSFTIGQISGLMFLFFVLALRYWAKNSLLKANFAIAPLIFLKIGPGLLALLFFNPLTSGVALLGIGLVGILSYFLLPSGTLLWNKWFWLLNHDSQFFDASHYGSQSIKSALLRIAKSGWLSESLARDLYLVILLAFIVLTLAIWFTRKPHSMRGKYLFFSLAVWDFLLLMPFTFKYSLPFGAIAIFSLLFEEKKSKNSFTPFEKIIFLFSVFVLPLAGLDLVGETLFFWIQKNNLPCLALTLLFAVLVRHSVLESKRKAPA